MAARLSPLLSCFLLFHLFRTASSEQPAFRSIFAFGDSLTDTGNLLASKNRSVFQIEGHLPYGITFFKKPTGRFSDGRIVVDFLAQRLGAPLLKPYLLLPRRQSRPPAVEDRFVNFAVAGATAQNAAFLLKSQNITATTPFSTDVQLKWFKHLLSGRSKVQLHKALIYFAEIGGNDYNFAFFAGKPYSEVYNSVPNVTAQIRKSLEVLIKTGVKNIVIEGNLPMGCTPLYIEVLSSLPKDRLGCVEIINELSHRHNVLLLEIVRHLRMKYRHVRIVYFDFEKAYTQVLTTPKIFGFTNTTSPCYDIIRFANPAVPFNLTAFDAVKACPDPAKYVSWDGVHLTEAMNKALTDLFFTKGFADPYPNFLTEI